MDGLLDRPTSDGSTAWDGTYRLFSADRYRSHRSHHGFVLWSRLHRRSTDGGDILCCEGSTEPKPLQCRIELLWPLHSVLKGFEGAENHRRWRESYGACIIHPPKRNSLKPWSKHLRRWVASIRQIVESAYDKLFNTFGLWRERPHELQGLRARLAARVALHNFCIWLNEQLGRPRLAFADLLGW
jgi:hypothetical protein